MAEEIRNIFVRYAFSDDNSDTDFWLSDSSDDLDLNEFITNCNKRVRVENFLETTSQYSEEEFRKHFRLSRNTADFCIDELERANILPTYSFGRVKVSARRAFLITLWYLANQETYRQVSDRFNVTESTAWKIIRKVTDYLVDRSNTVIKWPNNEDAETIGQEFKEKQGIGNIIGAIDGSHILINRKNVDQHAYCNRKGTHSIILQGVVDSKKKFIDVFVGEPGSLHDARVLKRSALYHKVTNGKIDLQNKFLLGDSAYPANLHWLLTPFKDNGHLTTDQRLFNYKHSSTRVVVENAFALLKGRFRRLRYFDHKDIKFIAKTVTAACVLHNICINYNDTTEDIESYCDEDDPHPD